MSPKITAKSIKGEGNTRNPFDSGGQFRLAGERRGQGGTRVGGLGGLAPKRDPIFTRGPREFRRKAESDLTEDMMPGDFLGTFPEWIFYKTLTDLRLDPNKDFSYQSSRMGGRKELGGAIVDFMIYDPNRAVNIQEPHWHQDAGSVKRISDRNQAVALARLGTPLIFVDPIDLERDRFWITREALQGRDHSSFSQGY